MCYTDKSAYFHSGNLFEENNPAYEKALYSNMFRIMLFTIKKNQIDGEIYHVLGLEESTL